LVLLQGVLVLGFRDEFRGGRLTAPALPRPRVHVPLLRKGLAALCIMLVALIVGVPVSLAALGAASLLLLTRRLKPERVFRELDWSLLVFFVGLFIITAAVHKGVVGEALLRFATTFGVDGIPGLAMVSLLASNLISNVPAVMLLAPMVRALPDATLLWLTLGMATTFAGNLTILGSVANMIVVEAARGRGVHVGFLSYLRLGVPVTVVTLLLGTLWMLWLAG
jgi:Na+/H+ antiporter NhaD/arsenite permease-like protein